LFKIVILKPGFASAVSYGARRAVAVQERFKAWPLPVLSPTARVASLFARTFKSLTYVSAKSYGARRVIVCKNV
jgi:hypothetical protein